jgi:ATP-dependent Clp protease ATP-binding subunit ClpA
MSGLSETLAGLSPRPRVGRPPGVQDHFTRRLIDIGLPDFFKEYLLGQDDALEQVCLRLGSEVLTRPLHQPLRYCAEGTPATGKSESAVLLADWLGIPYINIDAASMPSSHTAASQLLGSGRGIVGSYQSGRLEQAAKHHAGAVIEVSDLDHAVSEVRSAMADLFLQILENGEAQSATGAMFSCANLIIAFTMNLPGGQDEKVHQGIGFQNKPDAREVRQRVVSELKTMLSGAFLSRIGTPILFTPLEGEALAAILSRALQKALMSAIKRLHLDFQEVLVGPETAQLVLASLESSVAAFGARTVLEHGRTLAARAILDLQRRCGDFTGKIVEVLATPAGELTLHQR